MIGIPGTAPRPGHRPEGCLFSPRCAFVLDACRASEPPLGEVTGGHEARCFRSSEVMMLSAAARPGAPEPPEVDLESALVGVRALTASYGQREVVHDVDLASGRANASRS